MHTGIQAFDDLVGDLDGKVVLLAGGCGSGKTTILEAIVANLALNNTPVAWSSFAGRTRKFQRIDSIREIYSLDFGRGIETIGPGASSFLMT